MNPVTQLMNNTTGADGRVPVPMAETDAGLVAEESEKMRQQIRVQATEVGPILEALLHDAHGQIRWGLNE